MPIAIGFISGVFVGIALCFLVVVLHSLFGPRVVRSVSERIAPYREKGDVVGPLTPEEEVQATFFPETLKEQGVVLDHVDYDDV